MAKGRAGLHELLHHVGRARSCELDVRHTTVERRTFPQWEELGIRRVQDVLS